MATIKAGTSKMMAAALGATGGAADGAVKGKDDEDKAEDKDKEDEDKAEDKDKEDEDKAEDKDKEKEEKAREKQIKAYKKELEELETQRFKLSRDADKIEENTFHSKIERDVTRVSEETETQHLGPLLGDIRRDMWTFAAPF